MSKFAGRVQLAVFLVLLMGALGLVSAALAGCGSSGRSVTTVSSASTTSSVGASGATEQEVIDLADKAANALQKDAASTIAAINAGDKAYTDAAHPDVYAFADDMNMTVVAHPNATVRGTNLKGKADVTGKLWRDEILTAAAAGKSGWMQYVYPTADGSGYVNKACYFEPVTGNDGVKYIVCAARNLGPYTGAVQTTDSTVK